MIHPLQYNNNDMLDPYNYYYSSTGTESNTDGCTDNHHHHQPREKYLPSRRPVLRSTFSEIQRPSSSLRPSLRYQSTHFLSSHTVHPSDEEFTPLIKRSRQSRRRKNSNYHSNRWVSMVTIYALY